MSSARSRTTPSSASTRRASSRPGTSAPSGSRATPPTRPSAAASRCSTPRRTARAGLPLHAARRGPRERAGRAHRLAGPQGRHPVLGRRGHHRPARRGRRPDRLHQGHPRPHRAPRPRGHAAAERGAVAPARRAGRRLRDHRARPARHHPDLEPGRRAGQGLHRRRGDRPQLLDVLPGGRPAGRTAAAAPRRRPRDRGGSSTPAGGCARTAPGSGATSSSPRCTTTTGDLTGYAKVTRDRTDLKALEDAQDAFYAAFNHDFRTPVTALKGFVDAIRDADDDEREHLIDRVEASADRLLGMVEGLVAVRQPARRHATAAARRHRHRPGGAQRRPGPAPATGARPGPASRDDVVARAGQRRRDAPDGDQPVGERAEVLPAGHTGRGHASAGRARARPARGHRPRAGASTPTTWTRSSTSSSAGAWPRTTAAPASGWPACATSWSSRTAPSPSTARWGSGRRSPSSCPHRLLSLRTAQRPPAAPTVSGRAVASASPSARSPRPRPPASRSG